jgi:hypothetical protein
LKEREVGRAGGIVTELRNNRDRKGIHEKMGGR